MPFNLKDIAGAAMASKLKALRDSADSTEALRRIRFDEAHPAAGLVEHYLKAYQFRLSRHVVAADARQLFRRRANARHHVRKDLADEQCA